MHTRAKSIHVIAAIVAALCLIAATEASADITCNHISTPFTHPLNVHLGEPNDHARLRVAGDGDIEVGETVGGLTVPVTCVGAATVANTDRISVTDDSDDPQTAAANDGNTTLTIVSPSRFAPGVGQEEGSDEFSEIEFSLHPGEGDDTLELGSATSSGADDWVLGTGGLNWNAGLADPVPDADVTGIGQFRDLFVDAGLDDDTVSAQGGSGTGSAVAGPSPRLFIRGDDGNDRLTGGSTSTFGVGALLSGGPGDDLIQGGGAGHDLADYFDASGVTVDLGRTGPQATGQGRDTITGVAGVSGSPGGDRLVGGAAADLLHGWGGADSLEGGGGDDTLSGGDGYDALTYEHAPAGVRVNLLLGVASGGAGVDELFSGFEIVFGSPFADNLTGDDQPNVIFGLGGTDEISGLGGNDGVGIRDGEADTVSCGAQDDNVQADQASLDTVLTDCETADYLPEPAPGGGGTDSSARDTSVSFTLGGPRSQRVLAQKGVILTVGCPAEDCTAQMSAAGKLPQARRKLMAKPVTGSIRAGAAQLLRMKLTKRQLGQVAAALATGSRPRLTVTVQVSDSAGNTATQSRTFTARR